MSMFNKEVSKQEGAEWLEKLVQVFPNQPQYDRYYQALEAACKREGLNFSVNALEALAQELFLRQGSMGTFLKDPCILLGLTIETLLPGEHKQKVFVIT